LVEVPLKTCVTKRGEMTTKTAIKTNAKRLARRNGFRVLSPFSFSAAIILVTNDSVIRLTELSSIHYLHTYAQYLAKHVNHKQSP